MPLRRVESTSRGCRLRTITGLALKDLVNHDSAHDIAGNDLFTEVLPDFGIGGANRMIAMIGFPDSGRSRKASHRHHVRY